MLSVVQIAVGVIVVALLLAVPLQRQAHAETIEILRDTWGVPHIYAETEFGALYGQGYAMAQDRLGTMMKAYRKATGRMAEYFGPDWVERDYMVRLFRNEEISRDGFATLPPYYQEAISSFLAGVKRFMQEHPDQVPAWSIELEPYHLVALSRYVIWGWPLGQAMDELRQAPPKPDDGRGSNEWAVTARRTADGHVITLIDPHVSWEDEWLFYESHLHGGDLNVYGFGPTGVPYIALGHNEAISWAMTTGGPDTADVYELTRNPSNPLQYRYDDGWKTATYAPISIPVRTEAGIVTERRDAAYTHYGPVVEVRDDRAYAVKIAYAESVGLIEEIARINKARNLGEFLEALSFRMLMPQNIMYGDVYGNIYYQRTGLVPIRPEGYDWSKPVPGNTSATEWLGFHDTADLVQIINPPAGWMQNCNISPGTMTENSPMTADRYPKYIYNTSWDRTNPRGRRASALLAATEHMTIEDAIAIATDTYVEGERPWRKALLDAYDAQPDGDAQVSEAIELLREWDGHADKESAAMTVFRAWWRTLQAVKDDLPVATIEEGNTPPEAAQRALVDALRRAVEETVSRYGKVRVPWGDVYRARRGDESWPVSGVAGEAGLVTLRAVNGSDPDEAGVSTIEAGQSSTTVVALKKGAVRSYSVLPYGESEHPDSPHYTDQGRLLFSEGKLKDTWFQREDLEGHIESRETLNMSR